MRRKGAKVQLEGEGSCCTSAARPRVGLAWAVLLHNKSWFYVAITPFSRRGLNSGLVAADFSAVIPPHTPQLPHAPSQLTGMPHNLSWKVCPSHCVCEGETQTGDVFHHFSLVPPCSAVLSLPLKSATDASFLLLFVLASSKCAGKHSTGKSLSHSILRDEGSKPVTCNPLGCLSFFLISLEKKTELLPWL